MKKIVLLFVFTIGAITSKAQNKPLNNEQPTSMLMAFYNAYMSAFSVPDDPPHHFENSLAALRKKYLPQNAKSSLNNWY